MPELSVSSYQIDELNKLVFADLYRSHVDEKLKLYLTCAENHGFERVILASGALTYRFRDDLSVPYFQSAYFKEFVSLPERPNSFIVIEPGHKPSLYVEKHDDFWHSEPLAISHEVSEGFQVFEYFGSAGISVGKKTAYLGPTGSSIEKLPPNLINELAVNPDGFLTRVDFYRAWKTDYEINCLRLANLKAVQAHRVAEKYFHNGNSEFDIHLAYLALLKYQESELPYDNIVALNENAAVLHHGQLSKLPPESFRSLLIDAGAVHKGYASDITRTHAAQGADSDFVELNNALDALQRRIVAEAVPGRSYVELHILTHRLLASLLSDFELITVSAEQAFDSGLVSAFFPHGLGHLLGLQVHDKGGHLGNAQGDLNLPPDAHPFLRLTRTIEAGMVFTIEPGLYFIPKLLSKWDAKNCLNKSLLEKLMPYGGIRIEDNILVHKDRVENITRNAFSATV